MAVPADIGQTQCQSPSPEARGLKMIEDSRFSKVSLKAAPAPATARASSARPRRNHPVPIDEFDREHLGIAAKE
jgi:hypothetical protein